MPKRISAAVSRIVPLLLGAVLLGLTLSIASAEDPDNGPSGPGASPETADISGSGDGPSGGSGIGILGDNHFLGSVTATGNACFGNAACGAGYQPVFDLEVVESQADLVLKNAQTPTTFEWNLRAVDGSLQVRDNFPVSDVIPLIIEEGTPTNTLYLDSSGNIGMGTSAPAQELHLRRQNTATVIRQEITADPGDGLMRESEIWLGGSGLFFGVRHAPAGFTYPVLFKNGAPSDSLVVDSTGFVGVGESTPLTRLQVGPGDVGVVTAGASLLVEEGAASAMILKSTAGAESFFYQDAVNGLFGTASTTPMGIRTNNANRVWITAGGAVGIGTTNPTHLIQLAAGAFSDGANWSNASSASIKDNFAPVDTRAVLETLAQVPVQYWNYKSDDKAVVHMGPTAEDFFSAFALGGDDKSISTVDASGVAVAAIQGLYEVVKEKDALIVQQQQKLSEMDARLAALENGETGASASSRSALGQGGANLLLLSALGVALVATAIAAGLWARGLRRAS